MKVLAKCRAKYTAEVLKTLYTGSVLKARDAASQDVDFIEGGTELQVVAIDKQNDTVTVISPIDPDRVLVLAAEAVELFNEGLKIWEGVKALFLAVGGFFSKVGAAFGGLFKRKK